MIETVCKIKIFLIQDFKKSLLNTSEISDLYQRYYKFVSGGFEYRILKDTNLSLIVLKFLTLLFEYSRAAKLY